MAGNLSAGRVPPRAPFKWASCENVSMMPAVWLLLAYVTSGGGLAAPGCTHAPAGCGVLSLANLFDRVIQHSARMHGISNDLHSELEQYFLPSKNHIGRVSRNCHTSTLLTPDGKENAQRMAREELTEVILKLLVAWRDPLWHFHQITARQPDLANFSSDKALEMSAMVHELRKGVEKVAEKMQVLGMISNSVSSLASLEDILASESGEWRLMKDYELLYCFRRDSDKIQNYLKILKCRIVPQHGC
ncbi:prolactin-like isoform X2 [Nerophis lumbriciformis]|uniref:prolactin-like isoform X2 n=1 Tax=Nerophis lumbriciformis TaxID=546530 RepID=UPI002ADF478F|nr:prolactin-like isoform X2 [Nerophis lumbriciformis]